MATLTHLLTKKEIILQKQHTVGRAPENMLVMDDLDISRQHGWFYWEGQEWYYKDSSQNGTVVSKQFLNDAELPVEIGCTFQFGQNAKDLWVLTQTHPPCSYFLCIENQGEYLELQHSRLYLERPFPSVFFFQDEGHRWIANFEDHTEILIHKSIYTFGGKSWQYHENYVQPPTRSNQVLLDESHVYFSRDEKSGEWHVTVQARNIYLDLEVHVYHRILAVLADQMMKDTEKGLPQEKCGWLSTQEVIDRLDPNFDQEIDKYYINTQVYRFRKETKQHPFGALLANLLERDKDRLRFNHTQVHLPVVKV